MTEYPKRQTGSAAGWSRRTGLFSVVLLATVLVGHHFDLVETSAFLWVLAIVALLAALALLLAGLAFSRLWSFGDRGGRDLSIGALAALAVLAPYGVGAYWIMIYPPLRDISSDLENPPALATAAARTSDINVLAPTSPGERRLQTESYPLVIGHRYGLPFDETVEAVENVLRRQGWRLVDPLPAVSVGQNTLTIGALASSFILDLPADVAVRITADNETSLVDMRSASRYGRHDLGDNAARIVGFLAELDREVAGQVGTAASD